MNNKLLHTPDGMRDIYNEECEKKTILEERIGSEMKLFGYRPIETPSIEFSDVFSSAVGTTPSRELYRFFDREGDTLVLRPDFTPSIARAASRYFAGGEQAIRLSYKGKTFVNHLTYQGRLKETTQMGVELIGDGSVDADAEIIALVISSLLAAGLKEFQISLGHVAYFDSLAREAGLDGEKKEELKELIRNKNSFGAEKLLESFPMERGIRDSLSALPFQFGGADMLEQTMGACPSSQAREALQRLLDVYRILGIYGLDEYVSFDLGMMGNFMYYTGIILRGYTYGTGDAIVKGGRYDKLLGQFGLESASVGFVIVIDELMNAMNRQKTAPDTQMRRVGIVYASSDRELALHKAMELRSEGVCAQMHPAPEGMPPRLLAEKLRDTDPGLETDVITKHS